MEIITINLGNGGTRTAHTIWTQYINEYMYSKRRISISSHCRIEKKTATQNIFYTENKQNNPNETQYYIKDISIASQYILNKTILKSPFCKWYNLSNSMLNTQNLTMDSFQNHIRKEIEKCANCQGFIINQCIGSTNSKIPSNILQQIDFPKKTKATVRIYNLKENQFESAKNILCHLAESNESENISFIYNNEGLSKQCNNLLINASYENMNRILSKPISGLTYEQRFDVTNKANSVQTSNFLHELVDETVPFPQLHHIVSGYSPFQRKLDFNPHTLIDGYIRNFGCNVKTYKEILSECYNTYLDLVYSTYHCDVYRQQTKVKGCMMTNSERIKEVKKRLRNMFDINNWFFTSNKWNDISSENDVKYMGFKIIYGHDYQAYWTSSLYSWMKYIDGGGIRFIDWVPTGLKSAIREQSVLFDHDAKYLNCSPAKYDTTFFGNNAAYGQWLRLSLKTEIEKNKSVDLIDEEHLEFLNDLIMDYNDIVQEEQSDSDQDDSDSD